MTKKIFMYSFLVGAIALLVCAGLFFGLQYRQSMDASTSELQQETYYVARGVEQGGLAYLSSLESDRQVVWMAADGQVLFAGQQDDPQDLPSMDEMQAALKDGVGQATRNREGALTTDLYCALRLEDNSVVRLTMPLPTMLDALVAVSPVLWAFMLVLALSGILAFRAAKQIVRPINELDLEHPEQSHVPRFLGHGGGWDGRGGGELCRFGGP